MDLNFLKNPIILAVIAGILTYAYMWWDNKQKKEKNPKAVIEEIDYVPPAMVALLTLFIAYNLFGFNTSPGITNTNVEQVIEHGKPTTQGEMQGAMHGGGVKLIEGNPRIQSRFSDKLADSFDSNTYHLLGKNTIKLPQTDVFIDIAKF